MYISQLTRKKYNSGKVQWQRGVGPACGRGWGFQAVSGRSALPALPAVPRARHPAAPKPSRLGFLWRFCCVCVVIFDVVVPPPFTKQRSLHP